MKRLNCLLHEDDLCRSSLVARIFRHSAGIEQATMLPVCLTSPPKLVFCVEIDADSSQE